MFLYELYKVFLILLNVVMIWFVLNLNFCFIKVFIFCFFFMVKLFYLEYVCVCFVDLRGEDGFFVCLKWFLVKGYVEDVFIVIVFGIFFGILRLLSCWKGVYLFG